MWKRNITDEKTLENKSVRVKSPRMIKTIGRRN